MLYKYYFFILMFALFILNIGCTTFDDPYEKTRLRYRALVSELGEVRSLETLPVAKDGEFYLGHISHLVDETVSKAGVYETAVGSGDCLFAFRIDSKTNTIVSWRLAGKSDPSKCYE